MSLESFDNGFKRYFSFLENDYVSGGLSLLLILYGSYAAPKLPASIAKLMDNIFVRAVVFFLIVYLFKKSPSTALLVTAAVLVGLMALSSHKSNMEMMSDLVDMKTGTCMSCNCRGECPLRENCPCHRMVHQYVDYLKDREAFSDMKQENKEESIMDKMGNAYKSIVHKVEEMIETKEMPKEEVLGKVEKNVQMKPEPAPVMEVTSDVKAQEPEPELVFDEESLAALREKVELRKQRGQVIGFDETVEYASL